MTPLPRLIASLLSLAVLGAGIAATTAPPTASAEVKTFNDDRKGDPKRIKRVQVNHGLYNVHLKVRAYGISDFYDWFVDVNPSRPGPDYIAVASLETERFSVYDFVDWTGSGGGGDYPTTGTLRCKGKVDLVRHDKSVSITIRIPRSCLRTNHSDTSQPRRVRVNVQADDGYAITDRYPARQKLSPWVRRGPVR